MLDEQEQEQVLVDYWVNNYVPKEIGMCCLCANRGFVLMDPEISAKLGGYGHRQYTYCFCLNGRLLRRNQIKIPPV